jgi:hypothetical protein
LFDFHEVPNLIVAQVECVGIERVVADEGDENRLVLFREMHAARTPNDLSHAGHLLDTTAWSTITMVLEQSCR